MTRQVDDLEALLDSHVGAPAHLVGHSYGALLCLLLAIRRPELARTLVLAEPPAITLFVSGVPRPFELLKLLARRPRTAAAIIRFGAAGVAPASQALRRGDIDAGVRTFGQAVFGKDGFERMPGPQKEQVRANVSNIKAELLGSGFAPLDDAALRSLRTPVLLVRGQQSIALFQRLAERLEELLPRCERAVIPGARHAMQVDNPAAFNAAVLSFLARQRQAA